MNDFWKSYDSTAYRRGWDASLRGGTGALDRADGRNEKDEWYDGYHDAAEGSEKYARRDAKLVIVDAPVPPELLS